MIRAIDKAAIHRICSGQVVLDVAAAVKELVENSLDAGATSVEVRLKDFGAELIEVADNGCGVAPPNWQALTLKYHTSKIAHFADLQSLSSFGFRGEALSSLCALADVTITTRTANEPIATRLVFDHSGKLPPGPREQVARAVGTTVSVAKIFSPLPVRRREFERNVRREFAKLVSALQAYCVVSTHARILCTNQSGRSSARTTVVQTAGTGSMRENIIAVFGAKAAGGLDPVDITFPLSPSSSAAAAPAAPALPSAATGAAATAPAPLPASCCRVIGFLSRPGAGSGRSAGDRQFFFLNGRPVDLPRLSKLLNELYRSFNSLQFPAAFLNVSLGTDAYDVNVTPDKRKVFLHSEAALLSGLRAALSEYYSPDRYVYRAAPAGSVGKGLEERVRREVGEKGGVRRGVRRGVGDGEDEGEGGEEGEEEEEEEGRRKRVRVSSDSGGGAVGGVGINGGGRVGKRCGVVEHIGSSDRTGKLAERSGGDDGKTGDADNDGGRCGGDELNGGGQMEEDEEGVEVVEGEGDREQLRHQCERGEGRVDAAQGGPVWGSTGGRGGAIAERGEGSVFAGGAAGAAGGGAARAGGIGGGSATTLQGKDVTCGGGTADRSSLSRGYETRHKAAAERQRDWQRVQQVEEEEAEEEEEEEEPEQEEEEEERESEEANVGRRDGSSRAVRGGGQRSMRGVAAQAQGVGSRGVGRGRAGVESSGGVERAQGGADGRQAGLDAWLGKRGGGGRGGGGSGGGKMAGVDVGGRVRGRAGYGLAEDCGKGKAVERDEDESEEDEDTDEVREVEQADLPELVGSQLLPGTQLAGQHETSEMAVAEGAGKGRCCGGHAGELEGEEGQEGGERGGRIEGMETEEGTALGANRVAGSGEGWEVRGAEGSVQVQFNMRRVQQVWRQRAEREAREKREGRRGVAGHGKSERQRSFAAASVADGTSNTAHSSGGRKIQHEGEGKEAALEAAARELERRFDKRDFASMAVIGQFNLGFIIARLGSDLFIVDQVQHACWHELWHSLGHLTPPSNGFHFSVDESAPSGRRFCLSAVPFSKNIVFGASDVCELISMLADAPLPDPETPAGSASLPDAVLFHATAAAKDGTDGAPGVENHQGSLHENSTRSPQARRSEINNESGTVGGPSPRKGRCGAAEAPAPSPSASPSTIVAVRPSRVRVMLASRACRSSVMIGTALSQTQMSKILCQLSTLQSPWNCPHGRPTMRHLFDLRLLEKNMQDKDIY
ncbi:unnamed protein product [Closterium sp. NIES-54]